QAIGQAELRGDDSATATGPQHPEGRHAGAARRRAKSVIGVVGGDATFLAVKPQCIFKKLAQQSHLLRNDADIIGLRSRLQRAGSAHIAAGRAPYTKISASGIKRLNHAEALSHFAWAVMRQHPAARADADV